MPEYKFRICRNVTESADVTTMANSIDQAHELAIDDHMNPAFKWQLDEGNHHEAYIPDPDDWVAVRPPSYLGEVITELKSTLPNEMSNEPQELLKQAIASGLTFGECVSVFAEQRTPSELEWVSRAQAEHGKDGEVEVDSNAITSESDDGGAYVMAWVWVCDEGAGEEDEGDEEEDDDE